MLPMIHWFRRDLRLTDNTALAAAAKASGGAVVPVYTFDETIIHGRFASPGRTAWLLANLQQLEADLRTRGVPLVVARGNPVEVLPALIRATGARGVYWNRDYTPYAVQRDAALKTRLREAGFEAESFKDAVIFEFHEVLTKEGRPYTVYTPYARRWRQLVAEQSVRSLATPDLVPAVYPPELATTSAVLPVAPGGSAIPTLAQFGMALPYPLPDTGEHAARTCLARFVSLHRDAPIAAYAEQRNLPGVAGTSRLSPYLRLGIISPRQLLTAAHTLRDHPDGSNALTGVEAWLGELIWRDFYVQVLYHHPYVLRGAFRQAYDDLAWENDPAHFAAWQTGHTGYPIVDAAMRQLRQEGWMHNRARMIVASFLTKDLLVDWRWGERHFMHWLLDGDPAANNGGWQWAAGTGTDAQPFFRIFNPVSQGQKFDPDGTYVRCYLPELRHVPNKFIHEPHRMAPADQIRADLQIGRDYPQPIVEHKVQRERALALYATIRKAQSKA
ncbi:MAG: deoxyribodipyrimidine photo-lyase [Chloroflexia bacterium]|nr:deoxyribodipyrimidine photo-lyase [Chloroflexia bacterium]